mgnify:CR=1 FL=1
MNTSLARRFKGFGSAFLLMSALLLGATFATAQEGEVLDVPTEVDMQLCEAIAGPFNIENCKFDPPVTITTVGLEAPGMQFKNGESLTDNVHLRWMERVLGINVEYLWTIRGSGEEFETRLRLALSAGEQMPDYLVLGNGPLIHDLIDSGQFMPVDELFETYASPQLKAIMNENPTMWNPYIRDGRPYAIPRPDNWVVLDPTMWIRRDWLENLGLEAPTTLEELEVVMEAFTTQDPDGNGEDDTYGLSLGLRNGPSGVVGDASWLFGAFGTIPQQWNVSEDGTSLEYGSVQPEAREALAILRDWMEQGYIVPEAGTYPADVGEGAGPAISSGRAGIVFGPYWLDWNVGIDLVNNNPDADFWPYQIPAGPDGTMGRRGTPASLSAMIINKDMAHPEALIWYINYFYEVINPPSAGSAFEWGLHENYMWARDENGQPSTDRELIPGGWVNAGDYSPTGYPINPFAEYNANRHISEGIIETPFDRIYAGWPESQHESQAILLDSRDIAYENAFAGPKTELMIQVGDLLSTMELETFNKIIYGELPLEAFDEFVTQWKESGGEQITAEVNEWYQSVTE